MSRCTHIHTESQPLGFGRPTRYLDCPEPATHYLTFAGVPTGSPLCLAHATAIADAIESGRLPDEEPCGVVAAEIINGIALRPEATS